MRQNQTKIILLRVVKILAYLCVSLASLFLAFATVAGWFLRDGLGPDSVESTGSLAWWRFWRDFRFALLIGVPVLLLGLWCIFHGRKVTEEHTFPQNPPPRKPMD
jgi:hypothetical protein